MPPNFTDFGNTIFARKFYEFFGKKFVWQKIKKLCGIPNITPELDELNFVLKHHMAEKKWTCVSS